MSELLLELFSEEIPARMQIKAASQMLNELETKIKELDIAYNSAEYFVTPRRIALHIANLPNILPEKIIEKKGPKIDARPEAIEGFLRSTGLKLEELSIVDGCYYAKKQEAAKPLAPVLQAIIEQILLSFTWPKSMRMNDSRIRWVRPLRNILCLFEGEILPVTFGDLTANNYSFGHRFMAPEKITIASFAQYQDKMRKAYVILSSNERREIIVKQIAEITKNLNLKPILDQGLLDEVVGLVEYPNTLLGKIEQKFMAIPKEALVSAMKTHQRYFYLETEQEQLAPYFLVVANVAYGNDEMIIAGNEKVLKARLADAEFFWQKDLKQPISESLAKLARLVFHHKLGNMFDKANRIISLAEFIAQKLEFKDLDLIKKSALLCKTDLVSEMVGEFPELQGIMGGYYATSSGENPETAKAIAQHYAENADISLPGAIIAIADKIDNIIGLWIAGEKPTSSKDPFALRRAALAIIKLIRHHKLHLNLSELIAHAVNEYKQKLAAEEVISFFNERLKYYLKAEGFRHDLIMAVLTQDRDDIYQAITQIEALQNFITKPNAQELVFAIKRILNILAGAKANLTVKQELFAPVELELYHALCSPTLEELVKLVPFINKFFDEILVNDQDHELKQNRLNLLYNIAELSKKIADFNLIEM